MSLKIDLLSPAFLQNPYPDYAAVRESTPAYWHEPTGYWLVSRFEDVHLALRHPQFRSSRVHALFDGIAPERLAEFAPLSQMLKPRLLFTDGPDHQRLRSLISQAFAPRQIDWMRPIVRQTADQMLANLADRDEFDFIRDFADPLPSRVITQLLGLPAEHYEQFKAWTNDIYHFIGVSPVDRTTRAAKATASALELDQFLGQQLNQAEATPIGNLLSVLKQASEAGERLTTAEIIANIVGLLNAGHETTTNLLGNGLFLLLNHPDQLRMLHQEPTLLAGAIEEIARYESPVQIIARQVGDEALLGNVAFQAGANVLLMLGAANRDPQAFDRPNEFDIRRQGARHVAFGFGAHYCIGAALARLIAEEVFTRLLKAESALELTSSPRWRPYPIFRGLLEMKVRIVRS
jgi:cytochrome P450